MSFLFLMCVGFAVILRQVYFPPSHFCTEGFYKYDVFFFQQKTPSHHIFYFFPLSKTFLSFCRKKNVIIQAEKHFKELIPFATHSTKSQGISFQKTFADKVFFGFLESQNSHATIKNLDFSTKKYSNS